MDTYTWTVRNLPISVLFLINPPNHSSLAFWFRLKNKENRFTYFVRQAKLCLKGCIFGKLTKIRVSHLNSLLSYKKAFSHSQLLQHSEFFFDLKNPYWLEYKMQEILPSQRPPATCCHDNRLLKITSLFHALC